VIRRPAIPAASSGCPLVAALFQCRLNPLQDEVMDFAAFLEGGFSEGFVEGLRQVDT